MAFCAAICEKCDMLASAIDACRRERGEQTFRTALAKIYCARALSLAGRVSEAKETLALLAPVVQEQGWHNLSLQVRAQTLLLEGDVENDSIPALLAEMQEREIWYLQSLTVQDYLELFSAAGEAGQVKPFAREMLRKRLLVDVDEDGNNYPLLQISTLGGLRMHLGRDQVARTDEFSRTQRECLALLAAAPDHRLDQEEVQLAFWPDSQPEKARSTFDTMLSRLRRILKGKLQPQPVKKYLKLQKGVLSLEGVVVDASEVIVDIGRARDLVRRREFWQADVAYTMALSRWHGQFMPGSCSADQSVGYSHQLQKLCLDASLEWSNLLNESGQSRRSIEVLSHALSMDRCNESIMKALYRSHMRDGNISMAHQMLQQFEDVMRAESYSPTEIARVLATFKSVDKV
jgi:DNA-binding SARP family transcriptional activator